MIAGKLLAFHRSVRKSQLSAIMARTRLRLSKEQVQESLAKLIDDSQSSLTLRQLDLLLKWGILG